MFCTNTFFVGLMNFAGLHAPSHQFSVCSSPESHQLFKWISYAKLMDSTIKRLSARIIFNFSRVDIFLVETNKCQSTSCIKIQKLQCF